MQAAGSKAKVSADALSFAAFRSMEPIDCTFAVARIGPVCAGAVTVMSIGFGPGTISFALQVTVCFDCVQFHVSVFATLRNFTCDGSVIVTMTPEPLSLLKSSAMTRY